MCSISTNATFDEAASGLGRKDRNMIESRLAIFADDADVGKPGGLDSPTNRVKRFRDELSNVRKLTVGRHRIYYTGHHNQCSYFAFCIKPFKKTGVDDEDDPKFQRFLQRALGDAAIRQLRRPDTSDEG